MKIIAELGLNHNGHLQQALHMVDAAAEAGCDGIKVQCYNLPDFLPQGHELWDTAQNAWLPFDDHAKICERTHERGLLFGGTPTGLDGIQFLQDVGADWIKNGSDFLLRGDLIRKMLRTGLPTWVAVGMADEHEVRSLPTGVKTLACTSSYPCPDQEANLARVTRADGYSDHTTGTTAGVMAVALGAEMFEFHFTLDHDLPGPDHHFSRTPEETADLVREVRRAEEMLGTDRFHPTASEEPVRDKWRVTQLALRK